MPYPKTKKWKKVYFVIQTYPFFQTCGFTFSRKYADSIASQIGHLTGTKGRVVDFTRENLKKLDFLENHPFIVKN
jgi:hypothetical protein